MHIPAILPPNPLEELEQKDMRLRHITNFRILGKYLKLIILSIFQIPQL